VSQSEIRGGRGESFWQSTGRMFLEQEGVRADRGGGCMKMCDGNGIKRCVK
jgi:hypothetical protein